MTWWEELGDQPHLKGAKCTNTSNDSFFPERGTAQVTARDAKKVCRGEDGRPVCPVKDACLEYALENKERFGIWGGYSERERARLLKERRVAAVKQELEVAASRKRRSDAAKKAWETRRRQAVEQQEQAAEAATRKKEARASSTKARPRRRAA